MSLNVLTLPVDIPWVRLCVSDDMTDGRLCDGAMPPRWRSSLAIFSYEPPEEDQTYTDWIVSYLKVTCSITGYQAGSRQVGLDKKTAGFKTKKVTDDYQSAVSKYYPCHGALLEVAVGVHGREPGAIRAVTVMDRNLQPYFADFEPKKRELYELVTETGEFMSRSLESTNVRKGNTTTESHEVLDSVGLSGSLSHSAGVKKAQQPEVTSSTGADTSTKTKKINQEEVTDLRTSDQGREMRETYSHSTQLTQMYHQLNSYHIGTNRALFFVLPRPHVIQPKDENGEPIFTFVNGPREIEGIQEFFFVVMRPKGMEHVCFEAYLETAHIARDITMEPKERRQVSWHFGPLRAEVEDKSGFLDIGDGSYTNTKTKTESYPGPPAGWIIEGYTEHVTRTNDANYTVSANDTHLTVTATANGKFDDDAGKLYPASIEIEFIIDLRTIEEVPVRGRDSLFLTGRGVCCCGERELDSMLRMAESVTFEKSFSPAGVVAGARHPPGREPVGMPVVQANLMRAEIGREMMASINSATRYPRGIVGLAEAQFVSSAVVQSINATDHPDNTPAPKLPGLDRDLADRLQASAPRLTRRQLLQMTPAEQMERLGLSWEETAKLRRAAVGLTGERSAATEPFSPIVPDVCGLSREEAASVLGDAGLGLGKTVHRDSPDHCDVVLEQDPPPGENARRAYKVDLVLSGGRTLRMPDLTGRGLTEGLLALRDAGFQREPELKAAEAITPQHRIARTEPSAGTRWGRLEKVSITLEERRSTNG